MFQSCLIACRDLFSRKRDQRVRRPGTWLAGDCAALESRVLPAVDLVLGSSVFQLHPTNVPNQYAMDFTFFIANNGTTTANLTGTLHDESDNVRLRVVMSGDDVYGNGDDVQIGEPEFINKTDISTITLVGNGATTSLHMTGTLTANPNFHFILWKIDSTNVIAESDETNNVFTPAIPVAQAFNAILFSPATGFIAGTTQNLIPTASFKAVDETNYTNAILTMSLDEAKPGDQLNLGDTSYNGQSLQRAGKNVKLGDTVVGTVSGGKHNQPLSVQFNAGADNLLVTKVMESLTFKSKKSQPGERRLDLTIDMQSGQRLFGDGGLQPFTVAPHPKH